MKNKKLQIRNSTAEFLIFTAEAGEKSIEVMYAEENVWATQDMMARLYDTTKSNISLHLKNGYTEKEIDEEATVKKFSTVQTEGERKVQRNRKFYSLEAIISVGFKVNSTRAVQFRQWAINILKNYSVKGYIIDNDRMKNGAFLDEDYFEHLLDEIREIRASERRFYQKITDIYATAMDYNVNSPTTKEFFAVVQNKLHFAIHGHTAAEVIMKRADATKEHMGLTTWKNAPDGKIVKRDVSIAKNYLVKEELENLDRIVSMYLDYAEDQARRRIPVTMEDWAKKLNAFLQFNEREILENSGKVTSEMAKAFAESEFEKYRITQDRIFKSDFDRLIDKL
ncbi:virulence RhuM family protein [Clostridium sp. UBA1652]|uniref:virulence RhuM family protein n=1 Tax=Clostridium sp. UBA1652 TaxID=1946348 RepID=UPI00257B5D19|nr:virulence RhuM family protein [Clostridium sp. UBA1652]